MTWKYQTREGGSFMDIYDHAGEKVQTIDNDGTGFKIPRDVKTVMRQEAKKARTSGNTERWRNIHIRLASDDIAKQ